jgi:uncharacterized protein (DUF1697 family)
MSSSVCKDGGAYNAPMNQYIALFRGLNAGGSHKLPMADLKALLEKNGCADVRTYVQSGNAILRCPGTSVESLAKRVTAAISKRHGFEPRVFVLTRSELEKAAAGNPFPQADEKPQTLHLFFLAETPKKPNLAPLEAIKTKSEAFALKGKVLYVYTPDGFGISKLGGQAEKLLGVDATARNWRTVRTLLEMTKE